MATGDVQITIGDCGEMSIASVSKKVSINAMAQRAPNYIQFHKPDEALGLSSKFFDIAVMPGVFGCIDGSHVKNNNPWWG